MTKSEVAKARERIHKAAFACGNIDLAIDSFISEIDKIRERQVSNAREQIGKAIRNIETEKLQTAIEACREVDEILKKL